MRRDQKMSLHIGAHVCTMYVLQKVAVYIMTPKVKAL